MKASLYLVVVLVVVLFCGSVVMAAQPEDFYIPELLGASAGALVGSLGGLILGVVSIEDGPSWGVPLVSLSGFALGAALSTQFIGDVFGVEGNISFSLAFSAAGTFLGVLGAEVYGHTALLAMGPIGAVIGYNIGAKMKSDSTISTSQSWSLEMSVLEFSF